MATSIRPALETEQRLDFLAAQAGCTKASYLRECIEQGLQDVEEDDLAAVVLGRVQKGEVQVHAAADVRNDLRLSD